MFIPIFNGYVLGLILAILVFMPLIVALIYLPLGIQNLVVGKREKSRLKTSSGVWSIGLGMGCVIIAYVTLVILWKSNFPEIWILRGLYGS
jgi:hypothetical protein